MLRICFKQQAEEGYSLGEGRLSREAGEQGLEIAPRNLKQGPEFAPKTVLVGGDLNNFGLHQSPPPLCQDQSSSSS